MLCPKCGYLLEPTDLDCPRCARIDNSSNEPLPNANNTTIPDTLTANTNPIWGWVSLGVFVVVFFISVVLSIAHKSSSSWSDTAPSTKQIQPSSSSPSSTPDPSSVNPNLTRLTPDEQQYVVTWCGWIKYINTNDSTGLTDAQKWSVMFARVDQVSSDRMSGTNVPPSFESVDSLLADFLTDMKVAKLAYDMGSNDRFKTNMEQALSEGDAMGKELDATIHQINQDQTRQLIPISSEYEAAMNNLPKE